MIFCHQVCPYNTLSGCKKDEMNNGVCILQNNAGRTNGWISVKKAMPADAQTRVLVYVPKDLLIGEPKIDTDRYSKNRWVRYGDNVTHWMLLPNMPKEAEDGDR